MNQRHFQYFTVYFIVRTLGWCSVVFFALSCASNLAIAAEEPFKVTYEDHIKPVFREHCTSCHNSNDKKSGLALDTYQAVMAVTCPTLCSTRRMSPAPCAPAPACGPESERLSTECPKKTSLLMAASAGRKITSGGPA